MGRKFSVPEDIQIELPGDGVVFYANGKADKVRIFLSNESGNAYTVSTKDQIGDVRVFPGKIL